MCIYLYINSSFVVSTAYQAVNILQASLFALWCFDLVSSVAQPMKAMEDMLPDENGESMMDQQDVSEHLIFSDNVTVVLSYCLIFRLHEGAVIATT